MRSIWVPRNFLLRRNRTKPATFSNRKKCGRIDPMMSKKTRVSEPLFPLWPACTPPLLKSGQGGPPTIPKTLGGSFGKAFRTIEVGRRSRTSSRLEIRAGRAEGAWLRRQLVMPCSYKSANVSLFSFVQVALKFACSRPRSRRPPPVKKDSTGIVLPRIVPRS